MLGPTPGVGGAQLARTQPVWADCSPACPACPHTGIVSSTSPSAIASAHVVTAVAVLSASVMAGLPFEVRFASQLILDGQAANPPRIALHTAGANGGTPGSPTPPGGASLSTMYT